jgi:hypothetical protein
MQEGGRMKEEIALKCYECAVKTDGQIDMILGLIAKLHLLKSEKRQTMTPDDAASEIVITGMSSVLNEVRNALAITHEEQFENIINGLDSAIILAKKGEYYDAGQRLTKLASDPDAISNRALRKLFPDMQ